MDGILMRRLKPHCKLAERTGAIAAAVVLCAASLTMLGGCKDSSSSASATSPARVSLPVSATLPVSASAPAGAARLPLGGNITGLLGTVDPTSQHVDVEMPGAIYHVHTPNAKITLNGIGSSLQMLRPGLPVQVRAIAMDNRTHELEAASVSSWFPASSPSGGSGAQGSVAVGSAGVPLSQVTRDYHSRRQALRVADRLHSRETRLLRDPSEHVRRAKWRGHDEPPGHWKKHHGDEGDEGDSGDDRQSRQLEKVWQNEDPALRAYAAKLESQDD